jgi:hypothetical protein
MFHRVQFRYNHRAMSDSAHSRQFPEMELIVLRGVLQLAPRDPQGLGIDALALLAPYAWRDHDHQIVFEALRDLGGRYPQPLQEWLAAAITRKGFPDLDLNPYFVPTELAVEQLLQRIHELILERG